jgi:RNA polymerase sigma-32 factor
MNRRTVTRSSDPLRSYFADIRRDRLLTPEEECEIAREYRESGSPAAAHRLVTANLRFVVKVAQRYRWSGSKMSDLIQEGNIGLMRAARTFDPDKGLRFISYAVWSIRAAIQNHIVESHSLVKFGTTRAQRRLFFALGRTKHELERPEATGAESAPAIAERLGVTTHAMEEIGGRIAARDVSLDAPLGDDGDASHLDLVAGDEVAQDHQLASEEARRLMETRIREALGHLGDRERFIIEHRVMTDDPMTLTEVGAQLGLGRERTRQLEVRAKERLRRELRELAAEIDWPSAGPAVDRARELAA